MDAWLEEAKKDPSAQKCGMYLVHNGTVRASAKAVVRDLIPDEEKGRKRENGCCRFAELFV